MIYRAVRWILRACLNALYEIEINGGEHIQKIETGFQVIAQHHSYLDIPFLAFALGIERMIIFVARRDLWFLWILWRIIIFIHREKPTDEEINKIKSTLEKGLITGVFPEASRKAEKKEKMKRERGGVLGFARITHTPIVVVRIKAEALYPPSAKDSLFFCLKLIFALFFFPFSLLGFKSPIKRPRLVLEVSESQTLKQIKADYLREFGKRGKLLDLVDYLLDLKHPQSSVDKE